MPTWTCFKNWVGALWSVNLIWPYPLTMHFLLKQEGYFFKFFKGSSKSIRANISRWPNVSLSSWHASKTKASLRSDLIGGAGCTATYLLIYCDLFQEQLLVYPSQYKELFKGEAGGHGHGIGKPLSRRNFALEAVLHVYLYIYRHPHSDVCIWSHSSIVVSILVNEMVLSLMRRARDEDYIIYLFLYPDNSKNHCASARTCHGSIRMTQRVLLRAMQVSIPFYRRTN